MAAQELARWTRFASKGGIGRCTATVDCVAREIGDLMFLKDDEITVLMQLPDAGYYLGFCEGVVGRFSGTDVKFYGKLKRPIMAKRGSLGVADSRPISLDRVSPSCPESSSAQRAAISGSVRPGSSAAKHDSSSDSRPGNSGPKRKPLSPDPYLYSSSFDHTSEHDPTTAQQHELTASVSASSAYSALSTLTAASTTFSDANLWFSTEHSFLSSRVVPSSSSASVQPSSSTKSVSIQSSSMDSIPTFSSNSPQAASSSQSTSSFASTHASSVGSMERLIQSLSTPSSSMSQSTSQSMSASASESISGTSLNSSSTYDSMASAPTSNSTSSSTSFATNIVKSLIVAPLRLTKSPRPTVSPVPPPISPVLPQPGSDSALGLGAGSETTTCISSSLPQRSPLPPSFTLPATSSPPHSPLWPPPLVMPQSPPSPPSTASSAPDSTSEGDESSLYLDDGNDHNETTRLSTLHNHIDGMEEEDGETGIGLSLLGALADDDDDENRGLIGDVDRERLETGARGRDGRGLRHEAGESTATGGSTPIPWTRYTPSVSASPTGEHQADGLVSHALSTNHNMEDDEPGQRLEMERFENGQEEGEEEEGYWDCASDIYDDYRSSRYSMASKRMSAISVKSKSRLSSGKVPPVPSFSPDRNSFDAMSRPSVSSGRPSFSSASNKSQHDRAIHPSTHTQSSFYSRPSFESTSSADPGSPVTLEVTPHGPVDGPEVHLRPPIARQVSAENQLTRTPSVYSTQTLSPLSAQFPQVPNGASSTLRVANANNEAELDGEGVSGGKAHPHAMNLTSPLLYASFGASGRHSGYTEETELQSSVYSESDDGHGSRKSRRLRSDTDSMQSPVSPTDEPSMLSALRVHTENERMPGVGLGMHAIVVDDDGDEHFEGMSGDVHTDESFEGEMSFALSEASTASTGHTITPASLPPSSTGMPSALTPGAPASLKPGTPSTPGAPIIYETPTVATLGTLSTLTPTFATSGQDVTTPSTSLLNTLNHPFSRTSIFLPHPNAPKITPGGAGLGPMYARPPQANMSPNASPRSIQSPPNATAFSVQVLRHLRSISLAHGGRRPPMTLYARCEPDLNLSSGPVPIMFSLEPLPPLPHMPSSPLSGSSVTPTRASTVSAPARRSSAVPGALAPFRGVSHSSAKNTAPNGEADPNGISSLRLPRRSATTPAGMQDPAANGALISRPNFIPQVGAARPRSRSFSSFGEAVNVERLPERSHEEPVPQVQSMYASAAPVPISIPSQPVIMSGPTTHTLPASLRARHTPSPLSVQTSSLSLSRERSPNPDTPSPFKSPTSAGSHQLSVPNVTQFGLHPPSTGSSSPSPASSSPAEASSSLINFGECERDASPASGMTGRTSLSTTAHNVASPHPWLNNARLGSPDMPRKNSLDGAPPRKSSDSTDSRSQMPSPPPIADWYSHSARSSPLTQEVPLRGKLSLPALRGKANMRLKLDDAVSVTSSLGNQESETVQVQDMDFELVKPTLPQLSLGRSSQESSYGGRDGDGVYLDSPSIMDTVSMHSSAPRSPLVPDTMSLDIPPAESPTSIDAHRQRELKWMAVMPVVTPSQARKNKKVKRLLLEGVPSSVRYLVWCHLTDSKARAIPGVYAQLCKRPKVPAFSDVEEDAKICYPDQAQLHPSDGPLVSLLQAYLNMVPDIQYSSGLTCIAGHLLLLSPEEDAFWIFASMMDAHLRPYFSINTIQLEVDAALLSKAIEANDPGVCKKLYVTLGITPGAIARPWFSTLFVGTLPVDYLHRIWDVFLYEGVTVLFRVGLTLVQCVRHLVLQATSEEGALEYLVHPPLACLPSTAEAFLTQALTMKLKDDDVRKQRVKMEAQVKRQTQSRTITTNGPSGVQTPSISLPKAS